MPSVTILLFDIDKPDPFDLALCTKILENDAECGTKHRSIASLPKVFKSLDTWPESTELKCWYCERRFETKPVFIPKMITENAAGNAEIIPFGNFCGFSCPKRYLMESSFSLQERSRLLQNLHVLYRIFSGNDSFVPIEPSPSKYDREDYCGSSGIASDKYEEMINEIKANNWKKTDKKLIIDDDAVSGSIKLNEITKSQEIV